MKRFWVFALCFILCLAVLPISAAAEAETYHWYCMHEKDHRSPKIAPELAFVEELGGYYLDHADREAEDRVIYLTFDVGYENGNVQTVLDILRDAQVPAAFFILGHVITEHTDLVRRMAQEGHTVCNHSVRHKNMSQWSDAEFLAELHTLEERYAATTGCRMAAYYRPPEGTFSRQNLICAHENGYRTIFWSFAYPDWDNEKQMTPEQARKIILDNAHDGEVMLLHPTSATNAAILGEVIAALKEDGYRFGTLDELTQAGTAT